MSLFLDFSLSLPQAIASTPIKYITSKINRAKKKEKKDKGNLVTWQLW